MNLIKSLYLKQRFYIAVGSLIVAAILGHFFAPILAIAHILGLLFLGALVFDILLLYRHNNAIDCQRITPEKLSNGDENRIQIKLTNRYNFKVTIGVIDELPLEFQCRDFDRHISLQPGQTKSFDYHVRPTKRGSYIWGSVNAFASTTISLVERRYTPPTLQAIPCYPSFMQMRKYELIAMSNRLTEYGLKKIRRAGNQTEFEQIRDYVKGDDYRNINWKATARRSQLMVNQYQDQKSQPIYSIIDCGRAMKMPFNHMSLQDYAINTSLVLSNIAVMKHDKAGLICFDQKVKRIVPAGGRRVQVKNIMEALYNETTTFPEPDYEMLYANIRHHVKHRALLMLYTNFESIESMRRNLPYFQRMAKSHLLLIVFFSNQEIEKVTTQPCKTVEEIYIQTVAEKHLYEKRLIVKELQKNGIYTILTNPKNLTADTLNKYLELKSRNLI